MRQSSIRYIKSHRQILQIDAAPHFTITFLHILRQVKLPYDNKSSRFVATNLS